ncbi:MAG: hypothetical protein M1602_02750 [Firmicutes bacterium]|nr:hypothetical protein [Bacillota bacterium]
MANGGNVTTKRRNPADGTTWEFLQSGWWVWHVVAIVGTFYLGHLFWPR